MDPTLPPAPTPSLGPRELIELQPMGGQSMEPHPRETKPMGPLPRKLQLNDISLHKSGPTKLYTPLRVVKNLIFKIFFNLCKFTTKLYIELI